MARISPAELEDHVVKLLLARNAIAETFFLREAPRLAEACRRMADRFVHGGRLLAFGRGPYATDAQHVSVEFVHPVIVGKRALPALDLSTCFGPWLESILRPDDIAMGFGPPDGDADILATLRAARAGGAMTFALPGRPDDADYAVDSPSTCPFIHQEMLEILYHTLWETVHVFLEHHQSDHDVGAAEFLYPFLGRTKIDSEPLVAAVAESIREKVRDDESLRERMTGQAGRLCEIGIAMHDRIDAGGKMILFGNGGSATDANDWALDCFVPPKGLRPIPAISLSMEPAILSAVANDIGAESIFRRQLISHARSDDVAIALSTSGGSSNIVATLEEARDRGLLTVALLGSEGGEVMRRGLADFAIVVASDSIPRIQEIHASVYHVLREAIDLIDREAAVSA